MSKKDTFKLIITVILVLVLILLIVNSRSAVKKAQELRKKTLYAPELTLGQQVESDQQNLALTSQQAGQLGKFSYKSLEKYSESLVALRDPFSSLPIAVRAESVSNVLNLSGILWDKLMPLAVINNKVVKIGDKVGGSVLVDIKQDRVILSEGSLTREIRLGQ